MQKVKEKVPSWETTKTQSKKGFDKVYGWVDKLGPPINRFSNRIGSEAFWPTTLDIESYKAARILRSFCKDGFYTEEERPLGNEAGESGPQRGTTRVIKKIPEAVIKNAVGLAIFTTMRTGLWISGAGGSGVLVARKEDGTWSPPSGIMLHTAGLGFLVGVDIYDCVLVINNRKALESFTKVRATIGGEVSAVAGPVGVGGVLENDGKWKEANRPVFTYLKSRGFYAGVQIDGTVVIERTDENARFYNESEIGVLDILAGKVRYVPPELKMLNETLRAAEGETDVDTTLLERLNAEPAPGDFDVLPPGEAENDKYFGIPDVDDPDPYGVLALEREGMEIREAGTRSRPSSGTFEYHPKPSSPAFDKYYRKSLDNPPNYRRSMDAAPTTLSGSPLSATKPRFSMDNYSSSYSDAATQTSGPPTPMGMYAHSRGSDPSRVFYTGDEGEGSPYSDIFDIERTNTVSSYYGNSSRLTSEYSSPNSRATQSRQGSDYFKPGMHPLRRSSSDYAGLRRGSSTYSVSSHRYILESDDVAEVPLEERQIREKLESLDLPKGPPPALPPRQVNGVAAPASAPAPVSEFEDIALSR